MRSHKNHDMRRCILDIALKIDKIKKYERNEDAPPRQF